MYLKTLEIQGFKSFADKIEIEFGNGITSIVGPNGSGKSNISDAIRWVLGEQSAKTLRGNKMEDIIFAGTQTRKPLGFAEVSLNIDNSDMALPIEFNEVRITRRVYRSGESEYYINKSLCRLKDVHELFMDTGLGKDGYSMIGQGKIDEILSSRSEDRRQIFEEAAGISKYKYRKEEAQKKLEMTQENLLRLKDIICELDAQIVPLKEQSEKASRFIELRDELKILEINTFLDLIDRLRTNSETVNKNYESVSLKLEQEQEQLEEMEKALEVLQVTVKEKNNRIERVRTLLQKGITDVERYKNEMNILKNNMQNNQNNMQKIQADVQGYLQKKSQTEAELQAEKTSLEQLVEQEGLIKKDIALFEENNKKMMQTIEEAGNVIEALKSEVIEKMNEISEVKVKINSLNVLKNNFADRNTAISKEIEQKEDQIRQNRDTIQQLEESCEQSNKQMVQIKVQIADMNKEKQKNQREQQDLMNEYNRLFSSSKEKMSKKNLLEEMEKDYEGYNKSVKNILLEWQNGRLKHLKIHGPISQLIHVPQQFITAIEIALGSAMQNIVVDNEQDAKEAIAFLKSSRLGRATFLPVSSVNGKRLDDFGGKIASFPGFLGIAAQLIDYEGTYEGIINSLLGRVVVVGSIDDGIKMARNFGYKFKIVTLEGDILNPGGSLSGGSTNKVSSFLSRAAEIEGLKVEIKDLDASIARKKEQMKIKSMEMEKCEGDIREAEQSLKECESILIKNESDLKHNKTMVNGLTENVKVLMEEKKQIEYQIEDTQKNVQQLALTIKELEDRICHDEKSVAEKQERFKNELQVRDQLGQEIVEKRIALNSILKDIERHGERIVAYEQEIVSFDTAISKIEQEHLNLEESSDTIQNKIDQNNQVVLELENEVARLKEDIESQQNEKADEEQLMEQYQSELKKKRNDIISIQNEQRNVENKKTRVELELESTINKLWDDYEQTYSSAQEYRREIGNIQQAQKNIVQLKNQIKELGNINIDSIEEYKAVKERLEFLNNQSRDLEEAKAALTKVINDMLALMKKQFAEQFKTINEHFKEIFIQLFGGGRAELVLSSPENILESGIEIEVQPPGKKLQNLMLLSGGEKAFTAIALLFAILKVRPTPFCILDEIEAALDDVNVSKFAQYLGKYTDRTQFVVVTHRRGTMEAADILYGVTMQEHGVSKLLSLKMEEIAS